MFHVPLSMTALSYIYNRTDMPIVFCEFSKAQSSIFNLFVLHGEAYRQSLMKFSAKFQAKFNGLVLGS